MSSPSEIHAQDHWSALRTDVDPALRCAKQERPCTRCIKRNIGHLCHDEPRDHESRKSKSLAPSTVQETASQPDLGRTAATQNDGAMRPPSFDSAMGNTPAQAAKAAFDAAALAGRSSNPLQLVQPTPVSGIAASTLSSLSPCRWLETPPFLGFGAPSVCPTRAGAETTIPQLPVSRTPGWPRRTITTTCTTSTPTM